MKTTNNAEFSSYRHLDYAPILGNLRNLYLAIHALFESIKNQFNPVKATSNADSLQGRLQIWSQGKRAVIGCIPIIGNFILYKHDAKVDGKLVALLIDSGKNCVKFRDQLPKHLRESPSFILSIIHNKPRRSKSLSLKCGNPHILQGLELTKDRAFMLKAAKENIETLAYAPGLMSDLEFVKELHKELKKEYPMHHRDYLKYASKDLMENGEQILELAKLNDVDIIPYINKDSLNDNPQFLLNLMRALKKQLFVNTWTSYGASWETRSENVLDVLKKIASPKFLEDEEFIKSALEVDIHAFSFASDPIRAKFLEDPSSFFERVKTQIEKDSSIMRTIPIELSTHVPFLMKALGVNPNVIKYIPEDLVRTSPSLAEYIRKNLSLEQAGKLFGLSMQQIAN